MELKNTKLKLDDIQDAENAATLVDNDDLKTIGFHVVETYEADETSRASWMKKMKDATNLALQLTEEKSYPWPKASNVKFPLLTIAALQFQSRAYPSLVKAPDLVKWRVQGKDEGGVKAARGQRVSAHMSYQLLEQDEGWEEDQDKAFLALPILGCVFKKSYYDPLSQHNKSRLVLPKNLCVHYHARSIEDCERKTEIFELSKREIRERELDGIFIEHDYGPIAIADPKDEDKRQGLSPPMDDSDRPRVFLEQHCYLDLDGDGYKEPYVVTVDKETKWVARIVDRFGAIVTEQSKKIADLQSRIQALAEGVQEPQNPQELDQALRIEQTIIGMQEQVKALAEEKPDVLRIKAVEHYTKYSFIPSPDGGFYDIGFGLLLGDIGNSVNTIINQLIDAGSLQNSNSGFLGRGARIKGGNVRFPPNTWQRVESSGANLRDSIVPLPVNQPSSVLFELLGLLINYAERVGSVTDAMMGDNPGQNTPAYNMSAMLEQGLQVFNGIFKRTYRSFRSEIRKLYSLNAIYLDQEEYFKYQDTDSKVARTDYTADPQDLLPAADPSAFSNKEKMMKAQAVREASMSVPGYDPIKVEQRFLESLDIADAAEVFPLVPEKDENGQETGAMTYKFPPQPDPEIEFKKAETQASVLEKQSKAETNAMLAESKMLVDEATIIKLVAGAAKDADAPELERLKIIQKEQQSIREDLTERKKVDANTQSSDSGTD